jgi:hypothetical protein
VNEGVLDCFTTTMIIKGATGVAIAAAIGNLLQGWDGGAIAGGCVVILQEPSSSSSFFP